MSGSKKLKKQKEKKTSFILCWWNGNQISPDRHSERFVCQGRKIIKSRGTPGKTVAWELSCKSCNSTPKTGQIWKTTAPENWNTQQCCLCNASTLLLDLPLKGPPVRLNREESQRYMNPWLLCCSDHWRAQPNHTGSQGVVLRAIHGHWTQALTLRCAWNFSS